MYFMSPAGSLKAGLGGEIMPYALLCLLLASAFCVRLYGIGQPPLEFEPTRQYRSAIIARGYYFGNTDSVPGGRREIALINKEAEGLEEPPITELIVFINYVFAGGEFLWISRIISSLFWVTGGVFLFFTAKKFFSAIPSTLSTAFYLLNPYGVYASRSFQPDPLMIMLSIMSFYLIVSYFERESRKTLFIAAYVSSLAMLVKPMSLFFILGAFVSLKIAVEPEMRGVHNKRFFAFIIASTLPVFLYYVAFGMMIGDNITKLAPGSFMPVLIAQRVFWRGWLDRIRFTGGYFPVILAVFGVLLCNRRAARAFLLGLLSGYIAYGLVFTYHIHTHFYYHLPLIPIVSLSLGGFFEFLTVKMGLERAGAPPIILFGVVFVLLAANSLNQTRKALTGIDYGGELASLKDIGETVNHSTKTVLFSEHYGKHIKYHGEVSGLPWPLGPAELDEMFSEDADVNDSASLFGRRYLRDSPEYFIVEDVDDFYRQDELIDFLGSTYPVIARGNGYTIFDLR